MAGTTTPARPRSCWTDAYAATHCEGYRVDSEAGQHLGSVDRILWSEDGREPEALLVQSVSGDREILVRLRSITEIRPWDERVIVPRAITELLQTVKRKTPPRTR